MNLSWIAPSDNAGVFAYDIRFNTVPITENNWNSCISLGNIPKPASSGTLQNFTVEMPDPGVVYYFGIKAIDEAGNNSLLTVSSPAASQAKDTDGDGVPDLWETAHGLNPNVSDAGNDDDGDGLTNLQEYQRHTEPKNSDTDKDGFSDGDEIAQGYDPTDYTSHPTSSQSVVPGDLDCDGDVTLADGIIALKSYQVSSLHHHSVRMM
ncbi:MAG: hypothetical protein HC887_08265 [Desulfobacteraceae bacterium]|nr:hypothetical protein [Desulfobacteraceae bacterium]